MTDALRSSSAFSVFNRAVCFRRGLQRLQLGFQLPLFGVLRGQLNALDAIQPGADRRQDEQGRQGQRQLPPRLPMAAGGLSREQIDADYRSPRFLKASPTATAAKRRHVLQVGGIEPAVVAVNAGERVRHADRQVQVRPEESGRGPSVGRNRR